MNGDFNPIGDPLGFFLWDEFIDPGKPYQCPSCGRLLGEDTKRWSEEHQLKVIECPECGTISRVDDSGAGS